MILLIAIIALGMFAFGLPDGVLGVAWPSMSDSFGVSLGSYAAISAIFTATYTATGFVSGRFLNRIDTGPLLVASSIVMGAGFLGYALVPSWWSLLVLAGIVGAGAATLDAGLNLFAAINLSARVTNWIHASFSLGAFAGAPAMTFLLVADITWNWGFVLIAALLAVFAIAVLSTLSRWHSTRAAESEKEATTNSSAQPLTATLRLPAAQLSMLIMFLNVALEVTAAVWLFTLLTEERGLSVGIAGAWVTAYFGGIVAGRIALGAIANRLHPDRLLGISATLVILGTLSFWVSPIEIVGLAGVVLLGVGLGPIFPTMISATPDRVGPDHTNNTIGFLIAAAALGGLIPAAVGILSELTSFEAVAATLFAGSLLLAVSLKALSAQDCSPE